MVLSMPATRLASRQGSGGHSPLGRPIIDFSTPLPGRCVLAVYDNAGREVAVILDEQRAAGSHRVSWNRQDGGGHRVAAGSYVLRLSTQDGEAQARMVLLD